jgi:UDP-N-acetylglucosamine--N-acetylmuramyl-(pentapeptide) pyrophosphoryl-undecaprenol N-acetylglucosamine transferase
MKQIVLVTGGTAGHVFPAIAMAEKLKDQAIFHMVIDHRGHHFLNPYRHLFKTIHCLPIKRPQKKLFYILSLIWAIIRSAFILRSMRPDVVIGFGGYFSVPTVFCAQLLKIKTAIHEQNALLGKANRFLSKKANIIGISFKNTLMAPSRGLWCGNFLLKNREKFDHSLKRIEKDGPLKILITGGSLGAHFFTLLMAEVIPNLKKDSMEIYHQCPACDVQTLTELYQKHHINGTVVHFIDDMGKILSWCDVVICRAGATTISELLFFKKPALLIPLPSSVEGDQSHNANYLVSMGGAMVKNQKDLSVKDVIEFLQPPHDHIQKMSSCFDFYTPPDASLFFNQILGVSCY